MAVFFHFEGVHISLHNRNALKAFIINLMEAENHPLQRLDYIFCTDDYLRHINQQFLQHSTYTDILTFDLSSPTDKSITAEIYISGDRVKENASKFGVPFEEELHRVIFHGALHLCGYRDKTPQEKSHMRKKENDNLKRYFN